MTTTPAPTSNAIVAMPIPATIPNVYTAISSVQTALATNGISKERNNQQQGFKFRGIDDVLNALAPILARNRLCMLPRTLSRQVSERATKTGGILFYVALEVEYDLVSAIDGSKHTISTWGEAMDSGDKATNKAMSAAYKYAAIQAFAIPTEGDNDADATTHQVRQEDPHHQGPSREEIAEEEAKDAAFKKSEEEAKANCTTLGESFKKYGRLVAAACWYGTASDTYAERLRLMKLAADAIAHMEKALGAHFEDVLDAAVEGLPTPPPAGATEADKAAYRNLARPAYDKIVGTGSLKPANATK